jgi:hypothetical protein
MNTQNEHEQAIPPQTQDEQSRSFRLRAEHPRVTRLSRKVLAGGSAVALLVIGGAVLWSLQDNRSRSQAADELYSTDHHNVADGITALPKGASCSRLRHYQRFWRSGLNWAPVRTQTATTARSSRHCDTALPNR